MLARLLSKKPVFFLYLATLILTYLSLFECSEVDQNKKKGHLEPIFSYGKRHQVEVFEGFPTPKQFFQDFVSPSKPVLFKDAAKRSPAYKLWNDEYFLSYPESREYIVTVETKKKENRSQPANDVPFSTYLKHYRKKDVYMVNSVPNFLRKDVLVPSCLACENMIHENLLYNMMWMSNGGTKSVLHNDYAENLNCVFRGSKRFFIVDKKYMDLINVTDLGYSSVDVDRVDLDQYPGLYNMEHYEVTINPGDCLYVPFLWVHQVTSFNHNIAVNIWWKNKAEVDFDHCDPDANLTLKDVTFVGFDKIYDAEHKMIRGRLNHRIKTKGPMRFEDLMEVIIEAGDLVEPDSQMDGKIRELMKKVFVILDVDPTDGVITKKELDILSQDNLETIRNLFNEVIELQQQQENTNLPPPVKRELADEQLPPDWSKEERQGEDEWEENDLTDLWDDADGDHWPPAGGALVEPEIEPSAEKEEL
ncbi:tRNA wybutosine-synthesizing protein 5-like [Actinia tenebrosa]|uniref:tRNA wybutosine-synthesizing protein 5-like n=1 Tax=Actinia tenebrosa TaxID=6105 RepID=A0A6P8I875_ACTTE|nr:tRNA wybutosine-synthesizing protein 5-like [Actinia tenebrosa]